MASMQLSRWSRVLVGTISCLACLGRPVSAAGPPSTRNPLNVVTGGSFDQKHGALTAGPGPDGKPTLTGAHAGDDVLYRAFDFDSGVAGFKASVASAAGGRIELRLDKPDGPLLGTCPVPSTGAADHFTDTSCAVDNSRAGVRDVYLLFFGTGSIDVKTFVFLKSTVDTRPYIDVSGRVDAADDEPQATKAWGMPEAGFTDDFAGDALPNWTVTGFTVAGGEAKAAGTATAYTPRVYINKTDTGGEWRTMAEASLRADVTPVDRDAKPGIGFTSVDGKQSVYVVLNVADNAVQAFRHLSDGSTTAIHQHPIKPGDAALAAGQTYHVRLDWSPYADAMIVRVSAADDKPVANFRTVIDLPAARRPLMLNTGGAARFAHVRFDPHLDAWNYRWQWRKTPVLISDVCNPAVWKWTDGQYYMVWRKFGGDAFHGVATSTDAVHWTKLSDHVMRVRGDMNVVVDPFGDGRMYITPGGAKLPWWSSDGSDKFQTWTKTDKTLGDIFGNSRIQEIIDTKRCEQLAPIAFNGKTYRFIAFTENWTDAPQPHTVVLLSNTLTDWVKTDPKPVLPPRDNFWGEKGSAIGSAFALRDGQILLASCSCTFDGYTGASEPTNVTLRVDGKQPWKMTKLATLPDAPVSREHVWYQGPNFGTAFLYEPANDTLYFYGGFHDYSIGMMRIPNFSKGGGSPDAAALPGK